MVVKEIGFIVSFFLFGRNRCIITIGLLTTKVSSASWKHVIVRSGKEECSGGLDILG